MSRFAEIIEAICEDSSREAEWLRLLTQLEYAGCRKIVKGVPFEKVSPLVLQHVMEEASHAFLFASVIEKVDVVAGGAKQSVGAPNALSEAGWKYFQTLDHEVSRLQAEGFSYPAVSWIVEQRVLQIYPAYLKATRNADVKRVLKRILAQEKRHSEQFTGDFDPAFRTAALELESRLWSDFEIFLDQWLAGTAISRPRPFPSQVVAYV